jgi:hypothetical protein
MSGVRSSTLALLLLASFFLSFSGAASAGLPEDLAAARSALAAKDFPAAAKALDAAQLSAQDSETPVPAALLARIYYYRGVSLRLAGKNEEGAAEWRQALAIDNGFAWEEGLIEDPAVRDFFLALRPEVKDRMKIDLRYPEAVGAARLFVDGQQIAPGATAREGIHLAQVDCPDDRFHGQWTTFDKKFKWLKLCPKGVDTSVVVAATPTDEWGEMDDPFATPAENPPPPVPPTEEPKRNKKSGEEPMELPPEDGKAPLVRHAVSWPLVAAGGGTLAVSTAAFLVANSRKNAFLDPSNPDLQTPADVDAAAAKVNRVGYLAYGLGGVGVSLCAAAVIPW